MANGIVHFEIHAADVARAKAFYERVFGWRIERLGEVDYWGVTTARTTSPEGREVGIDGGMLPRPTDPPGPGAPATGFVCTVQVDDLEATLASATNAGASPALETTHMPGVGWIAYIVDTEGNVLGLLQPERDVHGPDVSAPELG